MFIGAIKMYNDLIEIIVSLIPVCVGVLITIIITIINENVKIKKEVMNEKNKYFREKHEKNIDILKNYCKCFTKYFRYMNGLCVTFHYALKKDIKYDEWLQLSEKLNELEIDEIELQQNIYFSSEDLNYFNKVSEQIRIKMNIANKYFNENEIDKYDVDDFVNLYNKFIELGCKHHKEIISLIKKEMNNM